MLIVEAMTGENTGLCASGSLRKETAMRRRPLLIIMFADARAAARPARSLRHHGASALTSRTDQQGDLR
jgi:hypothetical protein